MLRRRWRLGLRFAQVIALRSISTPKRRHILPALVALPTEAMLRKALIRADKMSYTWNVYEKKTPLFSCPPLVFSVY
jgi:hypothetical protein